MLGLRDAYRLFQIAKEKNIKLMFLGDSRQHSSVAAGAFMRTAAGVWRHHAATASPRSSGRRTGDHREAVELMFEGKTLEAFDMLDKKLGWVNEIEDAERTLPGHGGGIRRGAQGRHEVERDPAARPDACRGQAGHGRRPRAAAARGHDRQGGARVHALGQRRPDRGREGRRPQLPAGQGGHGPVLPERGRAQGRRRGSWSARPARHRCRSTRRRSSRRTARRR